MISDVYHTAGIFISFDIFLHNAIIPVYKCAVYLQLLIVSNYVGIPGARTTEIWLQYYGVFLGSPVR